MIDPKTGAASITGNSNLRCDTNIGGQGNLAN